MRILALVPARGGSKAIPRKNVELLGGRPLIDWTTAAALACGRFARVMVSTDDPQIARVAQECGAAVPFLRPAQFAGDDATALDVVAHVLDELGAAGEDFDAVAYLQPTSPFRTAAHLRSAVEKFVKAAPDTLVSVVRVPHNFTAGSLMHRDRGADALWLESPHGQPMRRQDKDAPYARNGPAILIVSARDVIERRRMYGERVLGFEMDRLSSLDIDDPLDLAMARCLVPLVESS